MLCALNVANNLEEILTVRDGDITGGSGSEFFAGDKLKLIDAIRIMMMASSNTLASAIARHIGEKLLENDMEVDSQ